MPAQANKVPYFQFGTDAGPLQGQERNQLDALLTTIFASLPASVTQAGGVGDGITNNTPFFTASAAAAGVDGVVTVPPGAWLLSSSPVGSGQTTWFVPDNANFTGPGVQIGRAHV